MTGYATNPLNLPRGYAWHFVGDKLRDGRPVPPDGVVLRHDGPVIPCEQGLHGSIDPWDALKYAPGETLCLCQYGGDVQWHGDPLDKIAASERAIVARMDFIEVLRHFARMQALSTIRQWPSPPDVVLDYLMTGDESIRAAAWAAASAAASAAARAAAWAAARAAARAAAEGAAWAAAWAAARAAARAAAEGAAEGAAWAAAEGAAWDAAAHVFRGLVAECFEGPLQYIKEQA